MNIAILDYNVVQPGFEEAGAEPTLRMLIYKYYAGHFDEKKACKFAREYISQLSIRGRPRTHSGRPLAKDKARTFEATKPWAAEGMSRATWFRRQAEQKVK